MTSAQSRRHAAQHPAHVVEAHEDEAHEAPPAPTQEPEHTLHLRAPHGTDEANYGGQRYRVDNDHVVDVPPEAAPGLLVRGGFVVERTAPSAELSGDTVKLEHPDGGESVSWGGQIYEAGDQGGITVPIEAANDLGWHGFVVRE